MPVDTYFEGVVVVVYFCGCTCVVVCTLTWKLTTNIVTESGGLQVSGVQILSSEWQTVFFTSHHRLAE